MGTVVDRQVEEEEPEVIGPGVAVVVVFMGGPGSDLDC